MPTFTTSFAPPPAVSGLAIEADLDFSRVVLTWDVSPTADVDFGGYRVYRSLDNGVTFTLLTLIAEKTSVTYSDYEAPLNTSLLYRVTQANLDFESDPVDAATDMTSLQWWVVVPDDSSLTFPIPKVTSASLTSPKVQEFYSPIGRPTRVAVGDVVLTEEGQLSFIVMPDNTGMIALLKRVQARMDGGILLKSPDGTVHTVQYGDMSRNFTNITGLQEVSIPFTGVS